MEDVRLRGCSAGAQRRHVLAEQHVRPGLPSLDLPQNLGAEALVRLVSMGCDLFAPIETPCTERSVFRDGHRSARTQRTLPSTKAPMAQADLAEAHSSCIKPSLCWSSSCSDFSGPCLGRDAQDEEALWLKQ
eukprot:COSAG01_NODE_5398_length_4288_cov_3.443781_5_plen_132_part_00